MTHQLKIGDLAPPFSLPACLPSLTSIGATEIQNVDLNSLQGSPFILFFYPKDMTSGCAVEAQNFKLALPNFQAIGIRIFGVSKDSLKSHEKFISKYELNFPLLSDKEAVMLNDYGVYVEKSMYGRKYMGIERTTFLIDSQGKIAKIWQKVKVPGHVDDVLKIARSLKV